MDIDTAISKLDTIDTSVTGSDELGFYLIGDNIEVSFSKEQIIVIAEQLISM